MARTSTSPYTFTATQQATGFLYFPKLWFDNDGYMTQFSAKDSATGLDLDPDRYSLYNKTITVDGLTYYKNTMGTATPTARPSKLAVYRTGTWYLDTNGNGIWDGCGTDACLSWGGEASDQPVLGDWSGTGTTKIGVYRAATGTWYLDKNGNGTWEGCGTDACLAWGGDPTDVPVVGDWTGDGRAKIGVYRDGTWYLDLVGDGVWRGCGPDACYQWGGSVGDRPLIGQW